MNLYEISQQYQAVMTEILDSEELSEELLTRLDSVHDSIESKAKAIGSTIKNLEAEALAIDNAIQNMQKRKKRLEKNCEWLAEYLKKELNNCKIKEVKTPEFDIKLRNCRPRVEIYDETSVPRYYFNQYVTYKPNRNKLAEDMKNDVIIPGVKLSDGISLSIK